MTANVIIPRANGAPLNPLVAFENHFGAGKDGKREGKKGRKEMGETPWKINFWSVHCVCCKQSREVNSANQL